MSNSNESLDAILKPIAAVVLVLPTMAAVIFLVAIWGGYVLSIMWGWFIVPTFGLPALSIPLAIGIGLVANMLTKQHIPASKDESAWLPLARGFLSPALTLLLGWIVTKFL